MADQNIDSLIYVVNSSKDELDRLTGVLKNTSGPKVDNILKAITKTAATLSGALTRLSNHVDVLPDPEPEPDMVEPIDPELFHAIKLALQVPKTLECRYCGGVLPYLE